MKVKIGDLKTHLSRYLRQLRKSGEPIEVCLREETVAYLSPVTESRAQAREEDAVAEARLEALGIRMIQSGRKSPVTPAQGEAGDGRTAENSVVSLRSEKDW